MNTHEIISLDHDHLLQVYARADFVLDHGHGCIVVDTDGREYIDCVAGIAVNALGYGDPDLQAALDQQAGKLWHVSNLYHTAPQARLAALLCETSFADKVYFSNCGASAPAPHRTTPRQTSALATTNGSSIASASSSDIASSSATRLPSAPLVTAR